MLSVFRYCMVEARKHYLLDILPTGRDAKLDSILGDIVLSFFNERQKDRKNESPQLSGRDIFR